METSTSHPVTVGERLRQARVAAGMSQNEVVEALSALDVTLTKAGLSKYERGGSMPKPRTLRALAEVLGVNIDFLLEGSLTTIRWLSFRKASKLGKKQQERTKTLALVQVEMLLTLERALQPSRERHPIPTTTVSDPADAERAAETLRAHLMTLRIRMSMTW